MNTNSPPPSPQADQNQDGDEVPVWCVYLGDEEAEPVHTIYWLWSYALALDLAQRMARDALIAYDAP